ncbi:MAG: thiamine pyrophosphate-dependent enzyme [Propionibacteriaceae bacterium]|nr:thiamine pyrophosphate-dependent enzyme [Propionibacteriaceae bacterium]
MPKEQNVDPHEVRAQSSVRPPEIPVNAYRLDLPAEVSRYGDDALINVLHDMIIIREFESMLQSVKTVGGWQGISYNHRGMVHLSMGQEAAVVGQSLELDPEDLIFGSHRSHGEVLAKSFSATRTMDDQDVRAVMESFLGGETLKYAEHIPHSTEAEVQANFILFGTLAEIFGRRAGFNRGMGGSMHGFFPPFGSMPNNGIVGGSAPLAVGAALFKRISNTPGIVVANIGDGAISAGPVWESLVFSAMDQYRGLWDESLGGHPPILFNVWNNFYSMGGQTSGETMAYDVLARVGAGVNPQAMHAERVDGFNPLAVANAVRRKKELLVGGQGPVLLDVLTYRYAGHTSQDTSSYRSSEEMEAWEQVDPIATFAATLINAGIISSTQVEEIYSRIIDKLTQVLRIAADDHMCPRVDATFVESAMFSNSQPPVIASQPVELLQNLGDNSRVQAIARKHRSAQDLEGAQNNPLEVFSYRDGLFEALVHRFSVDPTIVAWGQAHRDWDGVCGVYQGMTELLPYHRYFTTPVSEAAAVGAGAGYAMCGGHVVVEVMYADFLGRAGDELINQVAKWQALSAGLLRMPLVVRVCVGHDSAQVSQDLSSMLAQIPGLKIYYPATPHDAKGMLNTALAGVDPVIFFESEKLYDMGEFFTPGGVPSGLYDIEEGEVAVRLEGNDLTIATLGPSLYTAMQAAATLHNTYQLGAEVIDLRFAVPLKYDKLLESVKKTGRLILVSEAVERGSFLHTIATQVTNHVFDDLDAPVVVLGARNHVRANVELGDLTSPTATTILDAIHTLMVPLSGHTPSTDQTNEERLRRSSLGV